MGHLQTKMQAWQSGHQRSLEQSRRDVATALLSLGGSRDRGNLSDHGGWVGLGRLARWLRLLGVTEALLRTSG